MQNLIERPSKEKKLYSQKGIGIATFLGSPLASSFLIKHNYDVLGNSQKGEKALIAGIIFTILLFSLIFGLSDFAIERMPKQLIPALYTLAVYLIVEKIQGNEFKAVEEEGGEYMSNWKAAGIGLFSMILILGGILLFSLFDPVTDAYNQGIEDYTQNEVTANTIYIGWEEKTWLEIVNDINEIGIPEWEQNLSLLDSLELNLKLSTEMKTINAKLRKFSQLKIEELSLIRMAVRLNTSKYDTQIDSLNKELESIIF